MDKDELTVLALIGSPRKQGNTDRMADDVLAGARSGGRMRESVPTLRKPACPAEAHTRHAKQE